jgi:hypothetical protein
MRVQPERPPAFSLITANVVGVIPSAVPVGKNVIGLPVVPAAAIVVLEDAVETSIVLRPRNHVLDPPVVIAP